VELNLLPNQLFLTIPAFSLVGTPHAVSLQTGASQALLGVFALSGMYR